MSIPGFPDSDSSARDMPTAICLMGPTASGKTALALALCEHYDCEIISVDSALVYRGMDIGTAKPTSAERAKVPHHLLDILDPAETYSAADFRRDALRLMSDISARGRIPLLVGGSMLYFKVLRDGIADLPVAAPELRAEILAEAQRLGWPALHAQLDPETAATIHPQHSQRIQRALEVLRTTGTSLRELQRRAAPTPPDHRLLQLALCPTDRAVLHERIALRWREMLAQGFVDEVAGLYRRGDLHPDLPSMRAVGYRQVWDFLAGAIDFPEMELRALAATRQLAKRQLTWLRGWPDLQWFHTDAGQRAVDADIPATGTGAPIAQQVLKFLRRIPN